MTVGAGEGALWLALGVVLAVPYIAVGRRLEGDAAWWWVGGLVVAAFAYVSFAVARSAPAAAIGFEVAGVALYGGLAARGLRGDARWIALAWLLHPVWDVGMHRPGAYAYAPTAYVLLCLTFDLAVGLFLLGSRPRGRAFAGDTDS